MGTVATKSKSSPNVVQHQHFHGTINTTNFHSGAGDINASRNGKFISKLF